MKNWFQKYLTITFDTKPFLFLVLGFIVATVVGTMSFALGYFLVGELQGHDVRIFYQGVRLLDDRPTSFLFSISGMLSPIIIGTIGLLILFLFRKKFNVERLTFSQWTLVFLSLFILRQLDNFCFGIFRFLISGNLNLHSTESFITSRFNFLIHNREGFMVPVGLIVLAIVFFRFIPKNQRMTFLIAGPIGALAGYYLWLIEFGKIILP